MKTHGLITASLAMLCFGGAATAQEPVVGVADPDALFTRIPNPQLNVNKADGLHTS